MERSSYLDFFNKDDREKPYTSRNEVLADAGRELCALCSLMEKRRAGAVSAEFAESDWFLVRFHLERRTKASVKAGFSPVVSFLFDRLGLGPREQTAFLLGLCRLFGFLSDEQLERTLGGRRREPFGLSTADLLYRFRMELEKKDPEPVRTGRLALFLKEGWREDAAAPKAPLSFRYPVLQFLYGTEAEDGEEPETDFLTLKRFREDRQMPSVYLYEEQLLKLHRMCTGQTEDFTLCLTGEKGVGKEFLAGFLAFMEKRDLLVIDGERLLSAGCPDNGEWLMETACRCLLTGCIPYMKNPSAGSRDGIRRYVRGLILMGADEDRRLPEEENAPKPGGKFLSVPIPSPSAGQKAVLWREFLKEYRHEKELDPEAMGSKYVLNAGGIRNCLYAAAKWAAGDGRTELTGDDISWAMRQSQAGQLGSYAAVVPCVFGWEDLIVEEKVKNQLTYICGRMKYKSLVGNQWGFYDKMPYGRGLCALFYGPPGTGKTMAVQVIARELGLELYRVDLSRMVSKYIGETEKNISSLFEKARHMNVILFFDEADAFFSKRSEVKDSNDKNANAEVAHLLQKLEEYEGITILATNLKENMDDAFKRRIQFMVNFRFPSKETRRKLWHSLFPPKAPRARDLDLDFFAEHFELSGSQIKEIIVNAAFIAAGQNLPVGNSQMKEAVCMNFEKYGKILTNNDFGYLA